MLVMSGIQVDSTAYVEHGPCQRGTWYCCTIVPLCFSSENIQPIALGDDGTPTPGTILTATGWGRESDSSGGITDILREVDVPAMDWRDCNAIFDIVTEDILCIDSSGGMGTCNVSRTHIIQHLLP